MLGTRAVNDEAPTFAHARTPAKSLLKHRTGALRENAIYHGSLTVKAKGKSVLHTPHHQSRKFPQSASKAKSNNPYVLVTRPLGDKTPAPNRQLPPAQQLRTPKPQASKLLLEINESELPSTPECLLLPSATRRRKSLKLPSRSLKTPRTGGDYWNVSDAEESSVEMEGGDVNGGEADVHGPQEDDDEIEYMPPKVPEQPWAPSFDMPDYKTLGRAVIAIAHGARIDDTLDAFYSANIVSLSAEQDMLQQSGAFQDVALELAPIEDDDPFAIVSQNTPTSLPSQTRTSGSSRPASQASARTATPPVVKPIARTRSAVVGSAGSSTQPTARPVTKATPPTARPITRSTSARAVPSGSYTVAPTSRPTTGPSQPVRSTLVRKTAPTARPGPAAANGRILVRSSGSQLAADARGTTSTRTASNSRNTTANQRKVQEQPSDLILTFDTDADEDFIFKL